MMLFRRNHPPQLQAFFEWAALVSDEHDLLRIEFPGGNEKFFQFKFPLRQGDAPRRVKSARDDATFLVRMPRGKAPTSHPWRRLYSSPVIEVFEKSTRIAGPPPLRYGLSVDEKAAAVRLARNALASFLTQGLPARFSPEEALYHSRSRADVCVALWVRGHLRGSAVVEGAEFGAGIAEAAILASRDARFAPLAVEELPHTRIEVTLMNDLRIPLSREERSANIIYPEKGYVLCAGMKRGWFLPEVLHVRRFRDLAHFLSDLAREKAKVESADDETTFLCEVTDFIEAPNGATPFSLVDFATPLRAEAHSVLRALHAAASWLVRSQKPDGNIPPIEGPFDARRPHVDWPRLAFTAWALAEFGNAVNGSAERAAAKSAHSFLKRAIRGEFAFDNKNRELILAYFGKLSCALGEMDDAQEAARMIAERGNALPFDPIAFSQVATFGERMAERDGRLNAFAHFADTVRARFEESRARMGRMNLAVWAELVPAFRARDGRFADEVADWLKAHQLSSGAFSESTESDFAYTRGTGKIFEVLAFEPEKNREAIEKALSWLLSLQYNEENMYHVPEEVRPRLIGALRHDHFNPDAWIDAAGHFILGGSRLLARPSLWN